MQNKKTQLKGTSFILIGIIILALLSVFLIAIDPITGNYVLGEHIKTVNIRTQQSLGYKIVLTEINEKNPLKYVLINAKVKGLGTYRAYLEQNGIRYDLINSNLDQEDFFNYCNQTCNLTLTNGTFNLVVETDGVLVEIYSLKYLSAGKKELNEKVKQLITEEEIKEEEKISNSEATIAIIDEKSQQPEEIVMEKDVKYNETQNITKKNEKRVNKIDLRFGNPKFRTSPENKKIRVMIKSKSNVENLISGNKFKNKKQWREYQSVEIDEETFYELKYMSNQISEIYFDDEVNVLLNETIPLIRADIVQQQGLSGKNIKVCIIDSGYNGDYQEGYDFVNNDNIPDDELGHGTIVAEILKTIAKDVKLYIAKVINSEGKGYESDVLNAIDWCVQKNVDIISFSIGSGNYPGYCDINLVAGLANNATEQGILVFAATGNDRSLNTKSPSCGSKIISVSGSNKDDYVSGISNRNKLTNILAPSAVWINDKEYIGTSVSVPHIVGVASLLLENESFTQDSIRQRLRSTGKLIYDIDYNLTLIRVDAYNALINNITNNISIGDGAQGDSTNGEYQQLYGTVCTTPCNVDSDCYPNFCKEDYANPSVKYCAANNQCIHKSGSTCYIYDYLEKSSDCDFYGVNQPYPNAQHGSYWLCSHFGGTTYGWEKRSCATGLNGWWRCTLDGSSYSGCGAGLRVQLCQDGTPGSSGASCYEGGSGNYVEMGYCYSGFHCIYDAQYSFICVDEEGGSINCYLPPCPPTTTACKITGPNCGGLCTLVNKTYECDGSGSTIDHCNVLEDTIVHKYCENGTVCSGSACNSGYCYSSETCLSEYENCAWSSLKMSCHSTTHGCDYVAINSTYNVPANKSCVLGVGGVQIVTPSTETQACDRNTNYLCLLGSCKGEKRYSACNGARDCDENAATYFGRVYAYASSNYTLTTTCTNIKPNSTSNACDYNENTFCVEGTCVGQLRYSACNRTNLTNPLCDYSALKYYGFNPSIYAQTGYTLTSSCKTNGTVPCGYSTKYNCTLPGNYTYGFGDKYRDIYRCNASHQCSYDVGNDIVDCGTGCCYYNSTSKNATCKLNNTNDVHYWVFTYPFPQGDLTARDYCLYNSTHNHPEVYDCKVDSDCQATYFCNTTLHQCWFNGPSLEIRLNATSSCNSTSDNLTAHIYDLVDPSPYEPYAHFLWYKNGASLNSFYMPCDHKYNLSSQYVTDYANTGRSIILGGSSFDTNNDPIFTALSCKIGTCFIFSVVLGQTKFLNIPQSDVTGIELTEPNYSVELWFKLSETPTTGNYTLLIKQYSTTVDYELYIEKLVVGNPYLKFRQYRGSWKTLSYNANFGTDWHHVVVTYTNSSSGNYSMYVDGVLRNSITGTGTPRDTANAYVRIGAADATTRGFSGRIDEVRYYPNLRLSRQQIVSQYGSNNTNYSIIVSQETKTNDVWYVKGIPINSGGLNGSIKKSNNVTIKSSCTFTNCLTTGCLYIRNNISENRAIFDKYGNLDLHGFVYTSSIGTPDGADFIIKNSTNGVTLAWVDDNTGNLRLRGTITYNQGTYCTPPQNSFVIYNNNNQCVSYIDKGGNLWLRGNYSQNII